MKRSKQAKSVRNSIEAQEQEAVAGARNALAQVIAEGSHTDRSRAIEAIRSIDRGWRDKQKQFSVTYRLGKCYDARFELLGSFAENTDEMPSEATVQMQTALYALDHLANVLLTSLAAAGVAIYPTVGTSAGQQGELHKAAKDPLMSAIEEHPSD